MAFCGKSDVNKRSFNMFNAAQFVQLKYRVVSLLDSLYPAASHFTQRGGIVFIRNDRARELYRDIMRSPNTLTLVDFFIKLEFFLMREMNIQLDRALPQLNREQSLDVQKDNLYLKRAIAIDSTLSEMNKALADCLNLDTLLQEDETSLAPLNLPEMTDAQQQALRDISTILRHTNLHHNDVEHRAFQHYFSWTLLKPLFYPAADNRFFELYRALARSFIRNPPNTIDITLVIRAPEFGRHFEAQAEIVRSAQMLNQSPLANSEHQDLMQKNHILGAANIHHNALISEDLYARLLHVTHHPEGGTPSFLAYIQRNVYPVSLIPQQIENKTITELSKAFFSGQILFSRDERLIYYPPAPVIGHELDHNLTYGAGLYRGDIDLEPQYVKENMWGNSADEFFTTFGHPRYSEYNLYESMGLLPEFPGRIFYNQSSVFFSSFQFGPYVDERESINTLFVQARKTFINEHEQLAGNGVHLDH